MMQKKKKMVIIIYNPVVLPISTRLDYLLS